MAFLSLDKSRKRGLQQFEVPRDAVDFLDGGGSDGQNCLRAGCNLRPASVFDLIGDQLRLSNQDTEPLQLHLIGDFEADFCLTKQGKGVWRVWVCEREKG